MVVRLKKTLEPKENGGREEVGNRRSKGDNRSPRLTTRPVTLARIYTTSNSNYRIPCNKTRRDALPSGSAEPPRGIRHVVCTSGVPSLYVW